MPAINRRQLLQSGFATSAATLVPGSALRMLAAGTPVALERVRERVLEAVRQGRATGVSIAVVRRGQIVWTEGFGFADRELKIAATANTPFSLASITKVFTTALVATIAAQGHLSLDAPAMDYLQATPLRGPNGDPHAVTVRMLGAHCSGLPGTFAAYLTGGPVAAPSSGEVLRDYGRLAYAPGQIYEYGNIGFEALGAIVSDVARRPFGTLMQERLLTPLGMRSSFFSNEVERMASAAAGYDADDKRIGAYVTLTPPSGELYSSANDLARFALFYLRRGAPGTHQVLSDRWLRELETRVFRGPRGIDTTFGWFTGKLATGESYLFKGGGQPGVATKIFILPSADLACVVLTNRTDTAPLAEECCREIITSYVPGFTIPEEDAGPAPSSFVPSADLIGSWRGRLQNAGADQPTLFTLSAGGGATLALSGRPPERVSSIKRQSPGFEGMTNGVIDCAAGAAFGSRSLVLKLVPQAGKLCGRVTARGTRPGLLLANLPYVLTLERG